MKIMIIVFALLVSCTPTQRLNKLRTKHPQLFKQSSRIDTLTTIEYKDSVKTILKTIYQTVKEECPPCKSNVEIRQEGKTERTTIRQENKTDRREIKLVADTSKVKAKYTYKTVRVKQRGLLWFILGCVAGISLTLFFRELRRRKLTKD